MDRARARYEFLDSLRGVAAAGIVWLHITSVCGVFSVPPNAFLAVDFFFCLSGFVVAHAYGDAVRDVPSALEVLRRRAIRLMPMAVLGSVIGCAVALVRAAAAGDLSVADVMTAALLNGLLIPSSSVLPAYPEAYSLNPPLWSLALEMLASAAFVCGLDRLSTRVLAVLAVLAAAVVVRIGLGLDTLDFGSVPSSTAYGPARIAGPFLLGMLVQRAKVEPNRLGWLAVPALVALLLWPVTDIGLQIAAVVLVFPVIVMIAAGTAVPGRLLRLCRWSGTISFPLYVIHFPMVRLIAFLAERQGIRDDLAVATACVVVSVALTAAFVAAGKWIAAIRDTREPKGELTRSPGVAALMPRRAAVFPRTR